MIRKRLCMLALLTAMALVLSGCGINYSKTYSDAVESFADGEYADAAEAFEKLGDYSNAATYAAYSRGLVLFDQGQYIAAEPYFAKVRDFMYGETRYQYCYGCVLESQGSYSEAAAIFLALGQYENAPTLYRYNNARYAEDNNDFATALYDYQQAGDYSDAAIRLDNLRIQIYDQATLLMTEGYYEQALNLFSMLGNYYDSAEMARECKQHFRQARYDEAEALCESGDLAGAYQIFLSLTGFSDATTRAEELGLQLGYDLPTIE